MIKRFTQLIVLWVLTTLPVFAQLSPGDIAFTLINRDGTSAYGKNGDMFGFVALVNIPSGTVIRFSDRAWVGGAFINDGAEEEITLTLTSAIPAGEQVIIHLDNNNSFIPGAFIYSSGTSAGSIVTTVGSNMSFGGSGDQISAYVGSTNIAGLHAYDDQADGGVQDGTTKWSATGFNLFSSLESELPTGLTNGSTAIALFPNGNSESDNARYAGPLFSGTKTALLAAINDYTNWQFDNSTGYSSPTGAFTVNATTVAIPYFEDFESGAGGWVVSGSASNTWALGTPADDVINRAASGTNAWKTNLTGNYNNRDTSEVTGPALDFSGSPIDPVVALNVWWETEGGWDGGVLQSSIDNGATWQHVGTVGSGTNWYNNSSINADLGGVEDGFGWSGRNNEGTGSNGYRNAVDTLRNLGGQSNVRLRFAFGSDQTQTDDGIAFDDVRVFLPVDMDVKYQTTEIADGDTSPSTADGTQFADAATGSTSSRTFTIVNEGPDVLTLSGTPKVVITGADASNFIITTQPAGTVADGSSTSFTVQFAPNALRTFSAIVSIDNNDLANSPYTFSISGTGISACNLTASITTQTNVACNGGSNGALTVASTGGTANYSYVWTKNTAAFSTTSGSGASTNTITGLSAGNYAVTITDGNGCTATVSATISQPSSVVTASVVVDSTVKCNGGADGGATAFGSGGTPGYSYSWSGGIFGANFANTASISGVPVGLYTVTVTDANGCNVSKSVTITQPAALSVTVDVDSNVTCFGAADGGLTASPSGGVGSYTYQWNTGETTSSMRGYGAGTYTVTVTDGNGCTATNSNTITQPSVLSATAIEVSPESCPTCNDGKATVNPSGGTPGYTYSWSSGATTQTATGLDGGTYTVTVTDANGCYTSAISVTVSTTTPKTLPYFEDFESGAGDWVASGTNSSWEFGTPVGPTINTAASGSNSWKTRLNGNHNNNENSQVVSPNLSFSGSTTDPVVSMKVWWETEFSWDGAVLQSSTDNGSTWQNVGSQGSGMNWYNDGTINGNPGGQQTGWTGRASDSGSGGWVTATDTLRGLGGQKSVKLRVAFAGDPADASDGFAFDDVSVNYPIAIANVSKQDVLCNGENTGALTTTVTGGVPNYTYILVKGSTPIDTVSNSASTSNTRSNLTAGAYSVIVIDASGGRDTVTATIMEPAAPVVAYANADSMVSCNGLNDGGASAYGTGGVGGYTYSWSSPGTSGGNFSSVAGLAGGTYIVTVTDANGCSDTASVTITEPAALVANLTKTDISCNGSSNGSVTITQSGGTMPLTSFNLTNGTITKTSTTWATSHTFTGLSTGNYTATIIDVNGCTASNTITITQPATISATTSVTNVSCNSGNNGTIDLTVTGGTAPYTFNWGGGVTTEDRAGLAAGTYNVTVTDVNGCTKTATATITQPTVLAASISAQTNISCNGGSNGSATVSATGGTSGYTYSWNTTPVQTTATATGLAAGSYIVTVTDANGCIKTATATITQPTVLAASISAETNIACNGGTNGSATVSATGGTGAYTYSWNTIPVQTTATATGLAAGTYVVTVTDANGCAKTATATITQPTVLAASISSTTNVSCNGASTGSAIVTATGGTAGYTYSWNTTPVQTTATATGLSAGSYMVTVTDANGCTKTATATITQPTAISATTSVTNVSCNSGNNGTIDLTVTGGTAPYTFNWGGGVTTEDRAGLAAGTYNVTVTDVNGCTKTATATITQPTVLAASISAQTNISCNGGSNGSATVSATGGTTGYTYSWNTTPVQTTATATGLSAGSYTVTVTDANGCIKTATATITQPTVLAASISAQTNVACNGGSNGSATVTVTGGTANYTYSWNTTPVQTTVTATGLAAGSYMVTVTDANGCTKTATATITQPTALAASISAQTNVLCNGGTTGSATVTATGGTANYTYSWNTTPVQTTVTATGLAAGSYTVTVTDANGCIKTATATITQPTVLAASISAQTNVACNGGSNGSATVTVTGGTAGYTYSWNTTPVQTTATATGLAAGSYTVTVTDANGCIKTATATITQPTVLAASISAQTNVSCNGGTTGSATVTATGGTSGYTYSWNTTPVQTTATATGLAAGSYMVTVTDANGCTKTATAIITQPTLLVASISSQTNVLCNGGTTGSATVTATGGTANYTYSWNTTPVQTTVTATGLAAGSYTVTVTDANGCIKTATATITQPTVLAASISAQTNVACNGGTNGAATVTATGGTSGYTYSWNTTPVQTTATATGLAAGSYIVTVTDANGCTKTATATITQPTVLAASISAQTNVSINGGSNGSATVSATGGTTGYTYSWNTTPVQTTATATGLAAGSYIVTVTDANGCTVNSSVTITEPAPPTITSFTPGSGIEGSSVTLTGTNLTGITAISINGSSATASISNNTATSVTFTVPVGATTGLISLTNPGGTVSSVQNYIVLHTPADILLSASVVDENVAAGTQVGTFSTTDADAADTHIYTLVSGAGDADNAAFTLVAGALEINASPDFETKAAYSIRVRSTDPAGLFTEKIFTISVTDLNEMPSLPADTATAVNAVAENAANGTPVGITVYSTDPDAGSSVTYLLTNNAGGRFAIDATSGVVTVANGSLLDYEAGSSYVIAVQATDGSFVSLPSQFTIAITDVNEAPLTISLSSRVIDENVPVNTVVGSLTSTDQDAVNTFTYSLVPGAGAADNSSFAIAGSDLQIVVSPDFETQSSYSIRVRSTDQGGLSLDSVFIITINDLDEIAPSVVISSTASNPTNVSPIPVTITFSEDVNGFAATDITLNAGTVTNFAGSGSVYTFDLVPAGNGTYTVDVAAAMAQDMAGNDNLASNTFSIAYIVTSVAKTLDHTFEAELYPNPTQHAFTIEVSGLQKKAVEIVVVNSLGQVVSKQTVPQNGGVAKTMAGSEGLASGVYLVQISDGNTMIVKKVVVQP